MSYHLGFTDSFLFFLWLQGRSNNGHIYNVNKRQFEATMKREKISVMDYYDNNKNYDVFFRRNNRSNTPQGKVRFYYAQDTKIDVGTVFVMKGTTYLVISRDADESDVYYTSLAVKCDTSFTVYSNTENRYVVIPFVATSDKYTISHNSTISMISGSVVIYTGLNDYVREMEISDLYYNFGGYYRLGNYFYNNNLAYLYLEREVGRPDTYSFVYDGLTSLDLSAGTYQLTYTAIKNGNIINNPIISYAVSDNTIAAVSDTGLLTMIAAGNVTVTATWTDGDNITCTTTITIVDTSDPNPPVSTGTTVISGNTNLKNGYYRTYSAIFYDSSNSAVDGITAVWNISDCTFVNDLQQTVLDGNKFKIKVNNENLIGESFTLNASDAEGNFTTASITVHIVE